MISSPSLPGQPVIIFDDECGLCHRWVQFVLRWDRREVFRFAPLKSVAGQELLRGAGLPRDDTGTVVLIEGERWWVRSDATLRIFKHLGGWWRVLYGFILVPRVIRDSIYRVIARNRKRLSRCGVTADTHAAHTDRFLT